MFHHIALKTDLNKISYSLKSSIEIMNLRVLKCFKQYS